MSNAVRPSCRCRVLCPEMVLPQENTDEHFCARFFTSYASALPSPPCAMELRPNPISNLPSEGSRLSQLPSSNCCFTHRPVYTQAFFPSRPHNHKTQKHGSPPLISRCHTVACSSPKTCSHDSPVDRECGRLLSSLCSQAFAICNLCAKHDTSTYLLDGHPNTIPRHW